MNTKGSTNIKKPWDTVVFYDVSDGVPLFRYATVEELDMNDKDAAPGMFQLHGGEESLKMIRDRATFFRLDLTSERREAEARGMEPQRTCWRCPEQQHQVVSSERVERTTTEGWFAGHYVDPAHEHMVESVWNLGHEYGRYEKAALQIQHPKYKYQVVEMAIEPVGTTPMEWRTVYRGPGQPTTKESPQRLRVVRRPDSRIPGDPLVKDRELLRGNRADTIHGIGALVAIAEVRTEGQYDFIYARVTSAGEVNTAVSDSITDTLGRRLYLLDAGRQGASQLRSGLQIFAIKPDEQIEERKGGEPIQEAPGRGEVLSTSRKKDDLSSDTKTVTVSPQSSEPRDGAARGLPTAAGSEEPKARRSPFCTVKLRKEGEPIFLKREWQEEVPLGVPLDLYLEGGRRMRAIFEISGGEDHGIRTGASATGADEAYKAACAALMRLLPAHRQHSRNLLQGKCRFITCRQVDQTQPMAVVFFRQVRHTSTDDGGYVIEGLGTEEQSRGNGIGTALLRRVIATAVQECGQGGSPRTYISSVASASWWLSRMGMCRADER